MGIMEWPCSKSQVTGHQLKSETGNMRLVACSAISVLSVVCLYVLSLASVSFKSPLCALWFVFSSPTFPLAPPKPSNSRQEPGQRNYRDPFSDLE
jgi:hypothetical protein